MASTSQHLKLLAAVNSQWLNSTIINANNTAAILVHSFVTSCIDYCNAVLAGVPKVITNKLQWALNAAARVISGTHKFNRGLSRCSASQCSTACTVKRLRTLWNCANQSQVSHHGNISDPPFDSSWSYRATDSAFMADGLSVWLVCRSGIPCRTTCGIRLLAGTPGTISDNFWRRFCLRRTDAFSALQVSWRCAI